MPDTLNVPHCPACAVPVLDGEGCPLRCRRCAAALVRLPSRWGLLRMAALAGRVLNLEPRRPGKRFPAALPGREALAHFGPPSISVRDRTALVAYVTGAAPLETHLAALLAGVVDDMRQMRATLLKAIRRGDTHRDWLRRGPLAVSS